MRDQAKQAAVLHPGASRGSGERRGADRKRQRLMDGFVFSKYAPTPQPCTICDMNARGSKVEVWSDDAKPLLPGDRVTLYIAGDRKEVDAEVRWRKENTVGLRFVSALRAPRRRYA